MKEIRLFMHQERRKHPRKPLKVAMQVFDRATGDLAGYLGNISLEGLMLVTENPIEPNTHFEFRMNPPTHGTDREEIVFEALSLWCTPDQESQYYRAGFLLYNIDVYNLGMIEDLISQYGLQK